MKHTYQDKIKPFLYQQIISTANRSGFTDEQVSEILAVSPRTYAYFKSKQTMCSTATLMMYLTKMCESPIDFIDNARKLIYDLEEKIS